MAIIAKNNGGNSVRIDPGTYPARCYQMIHIGTVDENIQGQRKTLNKVRIGWELPTETHVFDQAKGPQPLVISKDFTLSLNEKANLRKTLEAWRGKQFTDEEVAGFDLLKLIGAPCMISVILTEKGHNEISGVIKLPKGLEVPESFNRPVVFDYDEHFDAGLVDNLPDFIKNKIKSSREWASKVHNQPPTVQAVPDNGDINDDLPF